MPKVPYDWTSWSEKRREEILTVDLPGGGDLPCAIFFPADYKIGMANLGIHYIYRALRELGVSAERFFASPLPFRSVESDTMLERFPLVLGGISYEPDVITFAQWIELAGIRASREYRESSSYAQPLIGAGGALTYINPLPLSGICDFIILGDGTETVRFLVKVLRQGRSREETLSTLAEHPSIFVPSVHGVGEHSLIAAKNDVSGDYGRSTWISKNSVFKDTLLLELQRGCPHGCRFCTLTGCFSPVRVRGPELVERDIDETLSVAEFSRIGFVTPEAGDYGYIDELLDFAEHRGKGVSFASLRVDNLTERMIKALVLGGGRTVTVAPETGEDSLRRKCGKRFSNEDVIEKLEMAARAGARSAKMYFMIGLPGETYEQVMSISALCEDVRSKTGLAVTASVSPFVPKPGTPWAGEVFAGEKKLKVLFSHLSRFFGGVSGVKLRTAGIREACVEYVLSWAGTEASRFIARNVLSGISHKKLLQLSDRKETEAELRRIGLAFPHFMKGGA
ncbi:MAG: radical SAM protein [Synergistaceae bacterium]|nr:radical SAM protein [Synergistaceae bacterium]